MPTSEVDAGLATLSDQLVLVTVLLYVAAMIGYALELAFAAPRTNQVSGARRKVLAGAGGPSADESAGSEVSATSTKPPASPGWAQRAGTVALVVGWLGWAANLAAVVIRGLAVERWPWANMYEFVVAICFAAVTAFLFMQIRFPVRFLGAFVFVASTIGLGFAVRYLHVQAGPVQPSLNTYWIAIHVSAAILASGLFMLAGVSGILYLIRKDGLSRLPTRTDLERVAHRAILVAFPIWTFAIIAGALWADRAWGRYWGWDPKEVWSFITWIGYAAYLHACTTAGWKGKKATIIQIIAFAALLFNLVGVNIFVGGLHSYADVP
ncbi:cytochrome c-type biogenesis protein CcsB [Sinosporangium album]|uniref:Cytochrome c-type biogenesis protein CcsB n=1 Tax=Sinosporangium album TaxID=504805 RepID=A0A1G7U9J4_9ACTN|nr:c-type cytochrome biogenesis protein CcsB [Sinosporangium album]SDG44094.1 cytochrome c-type biogenesis protein CcsB [Sinosporangium album]